MRSDYNYQKGSPKVLPGQLSISEPGIRMGKSIPRILDEQTGLIGNFFRQPVGCNGKTKTNKKNQKEINETPIVIERTLNASVDRVWEALTKIEQMKQWYFDMPALKPELGFEFQFDGQNEGRTFHHLCRITQVVTGKVLEFSLKV
jgi:Activator of Hsp90 ATPase homolog 1-like protein